MRQLGSCSIHSWSSSIKRWCNRATASAKNKTPPPPKPPPRHANRHRKPPKYTIPVSQNSINNNNDFFYILFARRESEGLRSWRVTTSGTPTIVFRRDIRANRCRWGALMPALKTVNWLEEIVVRPYVSRLWLFGRLC